MKRSIRAVLASSAAVALTGLGVAPASAGESTPAPEFPQVVADERINDKYYFPAGSACKDKIKVHEKYDYKLTVLSDNGKHIRLKEEIEDGYAKFYNPRTHRSVRVHLDSVGYIKSNIRTEKARVKGYGSDYLQGKGIKGIVYVKGQVKLTVYNTGNPYKTEFQIDKVKGKYVELCHKLGSRPVNGKLVVPPSLELPPPSEFK